MKKLTLFIFLFFSMVSSYAQENSPIRAKKNYTLTSCIYLNNEDSCLLDSDCIISFNVKKIKKISDDKYGGFVCIVKKGGKSKSFTKNNYLALDIRCYIEIAPSSKIIRFDWQDTHKGYNDRDNNKTVKALKENLNKSYTYKVQDKLIILESVDKTSKLALKMD